MTVLIGRLLVLRLGELLRLLLGKLLLLLLDGLLLLFLGRLSERAIEQPISYKTLPIDGLVGYRETNRIPQGHPLHAQCFRQIPPVLWASGGLEIVSS